MFACRWCPGMPARSASGFHGKEGVNGSSPLEGFARLSEIARTGHGELDPDRRADACKKPPRTTRECRSHARLSHKPQTASLEPI